MKLFQVKSSFTTLVEESVMSWAVCSQTFDHLRLFIISAVQTFDHLKWFIISAVQTFGASSDEE